MSFWKSLFGGGRSGSTAATHTVDYNGYRIEAAPYPEAGQYQVAGTITKTVDGAVKSHRFVRADRFATQTEAAEFAILKGRQIIDQQGDRLFG